MHKHGGARTRGLAAELKELRARSGMTTREVAKRTGFAIATLNRMENGQRTITPEDAASLLAVYGITGAQRTRILDLAREADLPNWWAAGGDQPPLHLQALISMEAEATKITHSAMPRIPGLLQIAEYARTVMMVGGLAPERARMEVETRLQRQAVVRKRNPPHYLAILDEMAVRRRTGSTAVMAAQLRHICDVAELPNVDIRLIPFDHGIHAGLDCSFALLQFPKAGPVVHLEHPSSSVFVDRETDVRLFQNAADSLLEVALTSAESVKFLRRLEGEFRRE